MRQKITITNLMYYILFGALGLIYSCGFTFLQTCLPYALIIAVTLLLAMMIYYKRRRVTNKQLAWLFLAIYIMIGMLVWGAETDRLSIIMYSTAFLTGVFYILNNVPTSKTEAFFNFIQYVAVFEAITIFLSVVIPGLMPGKFGFLYRPLIIDTMNKELERGIYSGFIGEKAAAAYLLNLGFAYTLSSIRKNGQLVKPNVLIAIVLFLAILFTGKRVLLVTAVMMFYVCLFVGQPWTKKIKALLLSVGAILLLIIFIKYVPTANITFQRFMLGDSYETVNGRKDMWSSAIRIFYNNPIFGCGYGSYQIISGSLYNAHNGYLQLLAEIGILGCAMFLIICMGTMVRAFKNLLFSKNRENYLAVNLLILTFLYAVTGNVFHTPEQLITLFMTSSIVYSNNRSAIQC